MSYKGIPELVPKVDCKGTYLLYEKRGQLDLLKNLMLSPIKKPRFESHTDPENPEGPYPGHPGARVGYEGDT